MHPANPIKGGALLTALFIMTLVAIVATAISTRLQMNIYRTRLLLTHDRMYFASQAVTFWALDELSNETKHFIRATEEGMVARYPKQLEQLIPQIQIKGGLYDLQARFNLNNLIEKKWIPGFIYLIDPILPNIQASEKTELTKYLFYWLTPYEMSQNNEGIGDYYMAQTPPYQQSNQLMQSTSELRLVKGFTAPVILALLPYITALPEVTAINVNTASKKVLTALGLKLKEDEVKQIISARGIKDKNTLTEIMQKIKVPLDQVTLESSYFLSSARISSGESNITVTTWFKRVRDAKGKVLVSIIRQSIGEVPAL